MTSDIRIGGFTIEEWLANDCLAIDAGNQTAQDFIDALEMVEKLAAENAALTRKGELICIETGNLMIERHQILKALELAEQFCTWLCEDSTKYPGTDAGNAAKSLRHDLRKALKGGSET